MTDKKKQLIKLATEIFGDIRPCSSGVYPKGEFSEDSFTEDAGYLIFWFNDRVGSTHIVSTYDEQP